MKHGMKSTCMRSCVVAVLSLISAFPTKVWPETGAVAASQTLLVLSPGQNGTTTLSWNSEGTATAQVYVSVDGGAESLVAQAPGHPGLTISWIGPGENFRIYTFRLYAHTDKSELLDSVMVRAVSTAFNNNARLRNLNGVLQLDGRPFSTHGVNNWDVFNRSLGGRDDDLSGIAGFAGLKEKGIRVARISLSGRWATPQELGMFWTDREEYFRLLDRVVDAAEENGVGLVFCMMWWHWALSDLAGEHLDQWAVPHSVTRQMMREFTTEVVERYKDSLTVWVWELGNEWNLDMDLPNGTQHLPPTDPKRGCPPTRDPVRDLWTTDIARPAMIEFANLVRSLDPIRPISTGHAISRPAQWNMYHFRTWTTDTEAQQREIALYHTPDPFDMLSVHTYHDEHLRLQTFREASDSRRLILFAGEHGDTDSNPDTSRYIERLAANKQFSPLSLVWQYNAVNQSDPWTITLGNGRTWMLDVLNNVLDVYLAWADTIDWNGADSSPGADANGDGITNFLTYALGGDPLVPHTTPLPHLRIHTDMQGKPQVDFIFYKTRSELTYIVETSETLSAESWQAHSAHPGQPGEEASISLPIPQSGRLFLRLKIPVD